MSTTEKEIPEYIAKIDTMFERYMRRRNVVLEQIGLQIGRAMTLHMNTGDSDIATLLAQHWLRYYDLTPDKVSMSNQMLSYFDLAVLFIERDDVLPTVLENPDNDKHLACMCMARAYRVSQGYCLSDGVNIRNLLEKWRGRPAPESATSTLKDTVDYLYGPAVWTLYSNDVKYEYKLVTLLRELGLPLLPVALDKPFSGKENNLPFDLS